MNKNVIFHVAVLAAASMLSAAEPVQNLYPNHEFQTMTRKDGKIVLKRHWYEGKILELGKMDETIAVKIQSVSVRYGGYNAVMAGPQHGLPPGKYCFSVWCKIDSGEKLNDVVFFRLINRYKTKTTGKSVSIEKKYTGPDKPVPGKWVELTGIFEIPPEAERAFFLFGHYGKSPVSVWYAAPSIEKNVED